jgi:hypothetical protein
MPMRLSNPYAAKFSREPVWAARPLCNAASSWRWQGRLVLPLHSVRERMSSLGNFPERVRDVCRAGAGDRAVEPRDRGVESLPQLPRPPSASARAKLIWWFGVFGAGHRTPEQTSGVSVLPRHLLALGRGRQVAKPAREASVGRRELVGAHRIRPGVAGVADGSHDVGALRVEFVVYGHGGWLFVVRLIVLLGRILFRPRFGAPNRFPAPKVLRAGT